MAAYAGNQASLREIEQKLRDKICAVCVDRNPDGSCDRDEEGACTLMLKLPQAVEAVLRVDSPYIEPYIESIRTNVCEQCENRNPDSSCDSRSTDHCMLDSYLPLVVEVIEDYFGKKQPRPERPMTVLPWPA